MPIQFQPISNDVLQAANRPLNGFNQVQTEPELVIRSTKKPRQLSTAIAPVRPLQRNPSPMLPIIIAAAAIALYFLLKK